MRARTLLGWVFFFGNAGVTTTSHGAEGNAVKLRPSASASVKPVPLARTDASASAISAENVQVASTVYFAAQLEELKVFAVADKLVSLFEQGLIPLGGGKQDAGASNTVAEQRLVAYRRGASQRLDASARKALYAELLDTNAVSPRREFEELFARYAESIETSVPGARARAGRALATHLARRRYGASFDAAVRLGQQVLEIERLLGDPAIEDAFGARDMWGVVDAVSTKHLGGASEGTRLRSLATHGRKILESLATLDTDSEALRSSAGEWRRASAKVPVTLLTAPAPRESSPGEPRK